MKRRGRKSAAQTPAPPSERIVGSSKNPKGSASSKSSASKIQISKEVEEVLKKKAKDYNESHQSKVTLATLKAVFRRGAGAYSSSHRPTIGGGKPNSRTAWAYARVNKFLLKKGGTKVKAAYVQDDDLMADGGEIKVPYNIYREFNEYVDKLPNFGYHGTQSNTMINPRPSKDGRYGVGFYLTLDPETAEYFGRLTKTNSGGYSKKNESANVFEFDLRGINLKYYNRAEDIRYIDFDELNKKKYDGIYLDSEGEIVIFNIDKLPNAKLVHSKNSSILLSEGGLIAPNGIKSNLTPEQYKLVRTPQFKAWFGDWENDPENASKVVDKNGEPKIKWRGDDNPKNVFDYINYDGHGVYYFGDKGFAESFGNKFNSYFINSRNPFLPNNLTKREEKEIRNLLKNYAHEILMQQVDRNGFKNLHDFLDNYYLIEEGFNQNSNPLDILIYQLKNGINYFILEMNIIIEWIKNKNYDGYESYEGNNDNIAVFNSKQIKLADGSNTTFDAENPDIRYKQGGKVGQDITCVNCGWSWNTDDSDELDKYVCHKCGFDNRTFYDSEPIGYADGGILDLYTASEIKKAYVSIKIPFDIERDKNFVYQVSKINDKPFEELENHVLNGVRGVSTSKYNIADWLSARQCLVLMKFSEFQKDNNTEQIKYNDISYLLSNGLDILFRIYDRKSKGDREYYDVLGNLFPKIALEFEIESQLYSDDRYTQYYFLEHIFNVYKSSKFRDYFSKKPRISSLRDITSILEEYLESGTAESDYPYERKPKYFDTDKISEVIKRGILNAIGVYTDESEWILKDAKLNIPKGSQLIFVLGTYDNHKDAYEEMIKKYHLRDSYKISFVKEKSISEFQSKKFAMQQRLHIENLENKKKDVDIKLYEIFNDKLYEIIEEIKQRLIYEIKESRTPPYMDYEDLSIEYGDNPLDIPKFKEMWTNAMSKLMELYDSEIHSVVSMKDKWSFVSIFSKFYDYIREKREESFSNDYEVAYSNDGRIWISLFYDRLVYAIKYFDYKDFIKDIKEKVGADIYKAYDKKDIRFKQGGNIEKYNNGGLIDAIATSIENLKKNGIVIKDNDKTITLIAYNMGNQERNPSLYNKSLIYSYIQPLRSANEIIANLDSMDYEHFDIDRLEEYRNDHLIILNQNEVVYDSGKSDIKYEKGAIIENQFDDLGNNQLVQVLKSFYSDLSESPIFENLDLKEGDYTFNVGDNQFVLFRGKPFSNIEKIKIGRFLQPYFDASKKPLFARFFDSYNVSGNNLIIKVKDMYEEGGEMISDTTIALPDTYSSIEKLKEILNTRGYDIVPIDKSIGKLAKGMTIEDIAEKHGVSVDDLNIELENGIKSEMEHTDDKMVARAIALDHLYENPKYYSKLQSLNLGNGGLMEKGGMVVGKSHQEADENGTGEKFIVSSTGQIVELEGGEAVIVGEALNSDDELEFEGQKKSPREIASYLNHAYGGVKFERGGHVDCGCNKKYYHGGELPSAVVDKLSGGEAVITKKTMESKDKYTFEGEKLTPRQILSRINHKYGGVSFAKGGEIGAKRFSPEIKLAKMVYFVNNIKNG